MEVDFWKWSSYSLWKCWKGRKKQHDNTCLQSPESLFVNLKRGKRMFVSTFNSPPEFSKRNSPISTVRILGVEVDATLTEIRAAYKRRALEVHPDKGGTAAAFQRVILGFKGSSFELISRSTWHPRNPVLFYFLVPPSKKGGGRLRDFFVGTTWLLLLHEFCCYFGEILQCSRKPS